MMIHTKTNTPKLISGETQELPVILTPAHAAIQGSALTHQGTMGCCVLLSNRLYGITNYHVLYGEHSPEYVHKYLAETLDVYSLHGETRRFRGKATPLLNATLDYALFELTAETTDVDQTTLLSLGKPIEPHIGMCLYKIGAATGLTHGIIDNVSRLDESLVIIHSDEKNPSEKLCDYGDSGSLWVYNDGSPHHRPVALHAGTSVNNHSMGRAYSFAAIFADLCLHLQIK